MNSRFIILIIFFSLTSSLNYAMLKETNDYDYLSDTDAAVQDILDRRASKIAVAQALAKQDFCNSTSSHSCRNLSYTIQIIKKRNADVINAIIICNKQEVLDKVSARIAQEDNAKKNNG